MDFAAHVFVYIRSKRACLPISRTVVAGQVETVCMSAQDLFYDKMIDDPRVSYFFEGVDMKKQRAHQVCTLFPSIADTSWKSACG